jgi:hypothetical protein
MALLWQQHRVKILSFIVAIYSFPLHFSRAIPYSLDGGWMTSLNLAIRDKLVFGRDFILPYGPLGVLSTRCNLYVNNLLLFAADIFLLAGCFHFLHKYVVPKGWFFFALITMLMFRSTIFSQSLFLIFIIYVLLNIQNNFRNYFELAYCASAGILLFFIKINYGLPAILGLLVLAVIMAIKMPARLLFFLAFSAALFGVIVFFVHINIAGYLKHSMPFFSGYDEGGYWPIKRKEEVFISALLLLAVIAGIVFSYLYRSLKKQTANLLTILFAGCIAITSFLLYRNGFTRADFYHYGEFFAVMPFWTMALVVLCGLHEKLAAKAIVILFVALAGYNLMLPDIKDKALRTKYYLSYLSPASYFEGIFTERKMDFEPIRLLGVDKVKQIGRKTVDIMPWETELLLYHGLNYHPRPALGYAPAFDSLNAAYFAGPSRPEVVMIQNFPIDYKYFFWEESMTKTSLRLNYRYGGFAGVNGRDSLKNGYFDTYLLLEHRGDTQEYPKFEKIGTRTAQLNEKVNIDFPPDEAVYMTVHFKYTTRGKFRRMLYQPPNLHVFFYYDDGNRGAYKVSVPALNQPVLVNKVVQNQEEMKYFYAGELKSCRNMKIFFFHAINPGFEPEYTIEFFKLKNY